MYLSEREASQYNPLTLAFLGDAVYEQLVRERLVLECERPAGDLHNLSTERVCATFQSKAVEEILPILDEKEAAVLKRGRNATGNTVPKHTKVIDYRRATALECLFGYLHLMGKKERISEIFDIIWKIQI
ncbi:MAG: Mini-ribonuclease 3 [Oscillospiraceae bacterium]